jgi:transposase
MKLIQLIYREKFRRHTIINTIKCIYNVLYSFNVRLYAYINRTGKNNAVIIYVQIHIWRNFLVFRRIIIFFRLHEGPIYGYIAKYLIKFMREEVTRNKRIVGAHPAYLMRTGHPFPEGKAANTLSTSLPYMFIIWCLIKHRDSFTF